MRYDDPNTELLYLSYEEWCLERGYVADEATFEKLGDFVHERGGFEPPMSLWDRAAAELGVKVKKLVQPITIDDEFRAAVQNMNSSDLLKRIQREPDFKTKFDALAAESAAPRSADANQEYSLTAAQYNALPAEIVQRKYRADTAFARAVDRLFARGEVRTTNVTSGAGR